MGLHCIFYEWFLRSKNFFPCSCPVVQSRIQNRVPNRLIRLKVCSLNLVKCETYLLNKQTKVYAATLVSRYGLSFVHAEVLKPPRKKLIYMKIVAYTQPHKMISTQESIIEYLYVVCQNFHRFLLPILYNSLDILFKHMAFAEKHANIVSLFHHK